jgi:hypothetical protein
MFMNGATIITERITTNSLPKKIRRVQRPALSVFFGVGRGTTSRVSLVPLPAFVTARVAVTTTAGFGWFVSWISSVVIIYLCNSEIAPHIYVPTFVIRLLLG